MAGSHETEPSLGRFDSIPGSRHGLEPVGNKPPERDRYRKRLLGLPRIIGPFMALLVVGFFACGERPSSNYAFISDTNGDGVISYLDAGQVWSASGANTDVNADGRNDEADVLAISAWPGLEGAPPNYNVISEKDGDRSPDSVVSCEDWAAVKAAVGRPVQSNDWIKYIGEDYLAVGIDDDELTVKFKHTLNTKGTKTMLTEQFGLEIAGVRDLYPEQPTEIDVKIPPKKLDKDGIVGTRQKLRGNAAFDNVRFIPVGGGRPEPVGTPLDCDTTSNTPAPVSTLTQKVS